MTKKSLVIQHNKIIEAKYKLSVLEQRLIKFLVSVIQGDDEDFKPYRISVSVLAELLELKRKDYYKAIKDTTEGLIGKVLVFEYGGKTIQTSWLSSAVYHEGEGVLILRFAPDLKPFLLHLKEQFTRYELGNIIRLKHTYSIRIYELLKQYERVGKRKFLVDDLRRILMLDEGEYKQFCDFRRWVLKTAKAELQEKTDIGFDWTEIKQGRRCVSIEFIISRNNGNIKSTDLAALTPGVRSEKNLGGKLELPRTTTRRVRSPCQGRGIPDYLDLPLTQKAETFPSSRVPAFHLLEKPRRVYHSSSRLSTIGTSV